MTNSIQHVNVMVDDLAAATEFYGVVLGLEPAATPDLGFPAQFFVVGGGQEIHVNQLDDVHPERSHFCLRLADFDAVFGRARAHGLLETGTWGEPRRLPSGVTQAFVRDPAGNLIELSCESGQPVDEAVFGVGATDDPIADASTD